MAKSWSEFYANPVGLDFIILNTACHIKMFKLITDKHPKNILEVGTGTGAMSIFLSYLGYKVTAIDNDKKILTRAINMAKKYNGKVRFILADAFKLPFKNKTFDVVFHQGLLEHFEDQEIIDMLNEQLRVGKAVVFSIPNNFYPRQDFGNERLLSKKHWDNFLSQHYKLVTSLNYNPHRKGILRGRIVYQILDTMYLAMITSK